MGSFQFDLSEMMVETEGKFIARCSLCELNETRGKRVKQNSSSVKFLTPFPPNSLLFRETVRFMRRSEILSL